MKYSYLITCVRLFSGQSATPAVVGTATCGNLYDYLIIPQGVYYPLNPMTAVPTATTCLPSNPSAQSCGDRFCDIFFANSGAFIRCKLAVRQQSQLASVKYCIKLSFTIAASAMPFLLHFRSDGSELSQAAGATAATTDASTGFCLRFQQSPQ